MDFKNIMDAALSVGEAELHLSGDSKNALNELIGKGVFKDKADFTQFILKAYGEYKLSGGSPQPTKADVTDIIQKTGIGNGMDTGDIEGKLVPLLTAAITSAGKDKMGI